MYTVPNTDNLAHIIDKLNISRGKSPITDPLLISTPSRISVTIRYIKKLYIHELLVI